MNKNRKAIKPDIIYTKVDEAPDLASGSLLPIIREFSKAANISIETKDISLAGRILANFSDGLFEDQKQPNDLNELREIVRTPEANIIKLPNISASIPQLNTAISELQQQGYNVPDYPETPKNAGEIEIKAIYAKILGSAVNPVLREGNSDRRVPKAVKEFAVKNPHDMGVWDPSSKTHVATMSEGDFYSNENSITITKQSVGTAHIEFISDTGSVTPLKQDLTFVDGDIIDSTMMSIRSLRKFIADQIQEAKSLGLLFSLHLKATMMKVSDPIIFGHVISVFFQEVFDKHSKKFLEIGIEPNNGLGDLFNKIDGLPKTEKKIIKTDIASCMESQPNLYMVDSSKGITNFHVPSDIIIDASMPALIRSGGKGWNPDGREQDTMCVIPDSSYAPIYDETIIFCKKFGAFDPAKMGTFSNVGLMAQKAEEYGSHPQTFEAPGKGTMRVIDAEGKLLLKNEVNTGDIWRMCITRDSAIRDWVKLAASRAQKTLSSTVFWLDRKRAHDAQLIQKVEKYLNDYDIDACDVQVMSPRDATRHSLECLRNGKDTVSVTGNVLRDYLTDLFPILELGTSSKMLSIVPLMNGGAMFETGAGGSAPKHVQQMIEEGHLRWDSLGEFCALVASFEFLGIEKKNEKAAVLALTLDQAIGKLLTEKKSPSRTVGEIDNRGSHFFLAKYWAEALSKQNENVELKKLFLPVANKLSANEDFIISELMAVQGSPVDLEGYYHASVRQVETIMRPSTTFNTIINQIVG